MPGVPDLNLPLLNALLRLLEKGEVNAAGFQKVVKVSPLTARHLRASLRELDLIIDEGEAQGSTEPRRIALTPLGRAVAKHVRSIDALLAGRRPR